MRVLIEAVGSPVWGPLLNFLSTSSEFIAGTDIDDLAWGLYKLDAGYIVPKYGEPELWPQLMDICKKHQINTVIPSIHEGLPEWAKKKDLLAENSINVVISELPTIKVCDDKWNLYNFFKTNNIPTPKTSLNPKYTFLKPRRGRGGTGMQKIDPAKDKSINMKGFITQEFLEGQEYSIDAFCDNENKPVCIVIRTRLATESGVSVKGQIVKDNEIENYVLRILNSMRFFGPVDIQCFRTQKGIFFTEINPRIAGGLSLSMSATGNWFEWIKQINKGKKIKPVPVKHNLIMLRYYNEVIISNEQRIST
jgi:carbamoyl-phosphate synthase large subunit